MLSRRRSSTFAASQRLAFPIASFWRSPGSQDISRLEPLIAPWVNSMALSGCDLELYPLHISFRFLGRSGPVVGAASCRDLR
jgi:hypothetical protein